MNQPSDSPSQDPRTIPDFGGQQNDREAALGDVAIELSLRDLQQTVDEWIRSIGVRYFSELTNLAILMEETGELARLFARKFGEQSAKSSDADRELGDEMADVLFVLVCLANQTGVDLTEAVRQNLRKKTDRDANRHRDNPKLRPTE